MTKPFDAADSSMGDLGPHPADDWLAEPMQLSPGAQRALQGVIRALLPPEPAPRPQDIEARVARQVAIMMQYMPRPASFGFGLILRTLELSPMLLVQAPSRLSSLPHGKAAAVLQRIASSRLLPVRMLMLAPRALVLSAYFDQPEIHERLDYAPRPFIRSRGERRLTLLRTSSGHRRVAQ